MGLPSYPWRFVHLAALWGYGVSQPVFSLLKGNPEFLVFTGASRVDTTLFAVLLAFGPALLCILVELAVGFVSQRAGAVVHLLALWLFGALAALQVVANSIHELLGRCSCRRLRRTQGLSRMHGGPRFARFSRRPSRCRSWAFSSS